MHGGPYYYFYMAQAVQIFRNNNILWTWRNKKGGSKLHYTITISYTPLIISSIIHYYNSSHKSYIMHAIRSTSINECLNAMRESRDLQGLLVPVRASVQEFEGYTAVSPVQHHCHHAIAGSEESYTLQRRIHH